MQRRSPSVCNTKVVGVGWAKTGTKTLGESLRLLGFDHVSTRLDLVDHWADGVTEPIFRVIDEHESFEDWPWLLMFAEIDQRYPGSKFILTLRDDDAWIDSYRNMIAGQEPDCVLDRRRRSLYGFDVKTASDRQLVSRRRQHEEHVRRYFSRRPGTLLEVDWSKGSGWGDVCPFLERPVPNVAFPHENKGTYRNRSSASSSSSDVSR